MDELSFVWDASPIGLARVEREGRFLAINPRFSQITGYSETELLARTYQQITHPDDLDPDVSEATELAANEEGSFYSMVKRYIRKDGRSVWVNLHVYAIRDEGRQFRHFFVFITELSPMVYSGDGAGTGHAPTGGRPKQKFTLADYARENPREAVIVVSILVALIKGQDLVSTVGLLFNR